MFEYPSPLRTRQGVTLIELMVSLAVLAILLMAAIPSFIELRQRSALRGAADQIASFWGDARFEALRRNTLVKFSFQTNAAGGMCLGAETTTASTMDTAPCDCFTAGACGIAVFPNDQSEWRGVRLASASTLGGETAADGAVIIDPKRVNIRDPDDDGMILLRSPPGGSADYRLNVAIDRNGRAVICEPTAAANKIPGFQDRRC